MTDDELFGAWKRKPGPETLLALLRPLQDPVYSLCRQVLPRTHDAEDAAQKVFCELLQILPTFEGADNLRAWIYRAALLTSINLKRSERRRIARERAHPPEEAALPSDADVEAIHEHVAHLPGDLRTLVVRHYFERRTLAELADLDRCSSVAIWKRLQKALDALRLSLTRAGLASLAIGVVAFLESRETFAAPAGLLTAAQSAGGGKTGGMVLSAKAGALSAAVALLGLSVLTAGVYRHRSAGPDPALTSSTPPKRPERAVAKRPASSDVAIPEAPDEDSVLTFPTGKAFWLAFRRAAALPDPAARSRALRRLGFKRSDEDFQSAWVRSRHPGEGDTYVESYFRSILDDWIPSEPDRALAFILGLPFDFTTNYHLVRFAGPAVQAWGERDPKSAVAFLRKLPPKYSVSEFAAGIELRARFRSDPDAFVTWLRALPRNASDLQEALRIALPYWTGQDPRSAVSWIEKLQGAYQESAFNALKSAWMSSESWSRKCALALESSKDLAEAASALTAQFLEGMTEADPDWDGRSPERWQSSLFQPLVMNALARRAEADPAGAAQFVERLPFDSWTISAVDAVARAWSRKDPDGALAWLTRQPFASIHAQEVAMVFRCWAIADPEAALRRADALPDGLRRATTATIFDQWAAQDPAAAARAALSLHEAPPAYALGRLAGAWAADHPDAALAWSRGLAQPQAREAAFACIAVALCDDFDRAIAVAGEISDAAHRRGIIERIISDKASGDPQGAAQALRKFPEAFEATFQEITRHFAFQDPAAGLAWADTLPEEHRMNVLKSIVFQSAFKNPEPARRWIEASTLPESNRKELLDILRRHSPKN